MTSDVEAPMHLDRVRFRRAATFTAALTTFAACSDPATAPDAPLTASTARGEAGGGPLPTRYVLPGPAVFPEGIAYDERTQRVFVSSTTDGTVFAGRSSDGTLSVFLPPGGDGRTTAVGLEVDDDSDLWVAGGGTGLVFVYDATTSVLIAKLAAGTAPTFINDIAVDRNGVAYITDSMRPVIYRAVPNGAGG